MRRLSTAVLSAALLFGFAGPALAVDLAPHKANYELSLESSRGGDVMAGSGSMSFEMIDACDGWAVRQRLSMRITNRDGQDVNMVSDYTTYESKDGLSMQFRTRQTSDGAVTSEVVGEAKLEREGGAGEAHYTLPEDTTKQLPAGTLFPTSHTIAIIEGAKAGKKFIVLPLFDGTTPGGAQDSTISVANWSATPMETGFAPLAALASGRVRIAFFDHEGSSQVPEYEVAMRYWENGVADALSMDFDNFVMHGKLTDLTLTKPGC